MHFIKTFINHRCIRKIANRCNRHPCPYVTFSDAKTNFNWTKESSHISYIIHLFRMCLFHIHTSIYHPSPRDHLFHKRRVITQIDFITYCVLYNTLTYRICHAFEWLIEKPRDLLVSVATDTACYSYRRRIARYSINI